MRASSRYAIRLLSLALLLLLSLGGVIVGRLMWDARRPAMGGVEYVALGSSFAAAPGVGTRAANSPVLCMRSSANYPQRLAQIRGLRLTDATCAGATTRHVLTERQYFLPPQIEAVQAHTRLVTITIGGNDVAYLGNLSAFSCQRNRAAVPLAWRRIACRLVPDRQVDSAFEYLERDIAQVVTDVRHRAPGAIVALVDYVSVLPPDNACAERLPITEEQLAQARLIASRLALVTERVATHTNIVLVRASELTKAHHVCSPEPWVFGYEFPPTPFSYGPLFYHPNDAAMAAIADELHRILPRDAGRAARF